MRVANRSSVRYSAGMSQAVGGFSMYLPTYPEDGNRSGRLPRVDIYTAYMES